ncbi:MAG: 2-keto-4-pentenoate hydratase [Pseudomonadales bacterium]
MTQSWAQELAEAWQHTAPRPVKADPKISIEEAYGTQKAFVELRGDPIAGYKAGLTSHAAQQAQGLASPVSGVLFKSVRFESGAEIESSLMGIPLIETEIGFLVGRDVTSPVSRETVSAALAAFIPMVEIVDVSFSERPIATDIIACNVAAAYYIESQSRHDIARVNDVGLCLYADGELKHKGAATDALGDQLEAAAWLINQTLDQGYAVRAGQVLMTGSLGAVCPGRPGNYRVDYGEFGEILFSLK